MFEEENQLPPYRKIVALLEPDTRFSATMKLAVRAAQRLGSGLTAVSISAAGHAREADDALYSICLEFVKDSSVEIHWRALEVVPRTKGADTSAIQAATRMADFVFASLETAPSFLTAGNAAEIPYHLVRESGRPVVFSPPDEDYENLGPIENFAARVTIAWDGGREATRAVRDALPLLILADDVIVLSVDSDRGGETSISGCREIAKYLTAHGIPVRLHQTYVAHGDVGGTILSRASESQADLVVMGACAHPHGLGVSIGDATRHVLENMTVPVLMSC